MRDMKNMHLFQRFIIFIVVIMLAACSTKVTQERKPQVKEKKPPVDYSKAKKNCYLTFDDGPHKNDLEIIEILARYNAKATFFYNGYNVSGREAIIRKVVASGHSLGSHSYSHKNLQTASTQIQYTEIKKNQDILTKYAPVKVFRPSYGVSTIYSRTVLKSLGLKEVKWNVDTFDWRAPSVQYIVDRAARSKNYNKPIILMHSIANKTVQALPQILNTLKAQGCRFSKF